jgi:choline dehydrogenase
VEFDYIIIGSGSAGSAVAGRLSENSSSKVLVLEAGGSDKRLPILMPAATYLTAITNPKYDWRYKAAADSTRNGRQDFMPRGKVLGGSSSINGMCYVRGQPDDFDDWAEEGCAGWSFKDVLPYFKKCERNEDGETEFHGGDGPVSVSNIRERHKLSDAFLAAAGNAGLRVTNDINVPPNDGIGYIQVTQKGGWRCSAARGYLWPATRRKNFSLLLHAHVRRILFTGKRASGVEFTRGGQTQQATASRAVVLCAGAISSPQILMLSGIGNASHLREKGITPIHDLPWVGENFHDHPGTNVTMWVNQTTYNVQTGLPRYLLYGARWLFTGKGPGSSPDAHVIGFHRSRAGQNRCDLQYHFTPAGYDLTEDGPILFDRPAVTGYTNIHRPWSRGSIALKSNDPFDQPLIQPNLFGDDRDLETLVLGSKFLRRIFETDPIRQYVIGEHMPGAAVQTDDEWRDYVRNSAIGIYHPAGTCKMGTGKTAVVDPQLKVHGIDSLYIADASIMPVIVSGNLNANCMMIGEKCADMLKEADSRGGWVSAA